MPLPMPIPRRTLLVVHDAHSLRLLASLIEATGEPLSEKAIGAAQYVDERELRHVGREELRREIDRRLNPKPNSER